MSALAPVDAAEWRPGMKVKCLKGVSHKARRRVSDSVFGDKVGTARTAVYPVAGEVYTLRHVNQVDVDKVLILLEEVRNSHLTSFIKAGLEPGFDAKFFEINPVSARGSTSNAESAGGVDSSPISPAANSHLLSEAPPLSQATADNGRHRPQPVPAGTHRADGGADITMKHEGIRT